eukprot:TRINITY_DN4442_c0_g2_i1.p1 TRINITY_DN4442_c0_g2~~TRINITY_DN4442_c0_g2_i1.p1  ORF type:complete len:798 (+),score=153.50 TRINITY_DN4442_c0_g2_i1:59-2452(+)
MAHSDSTATLTETDSGDSMGQRVGPPRLTVIEGAKTPTYRLDMPTCVFGRDNTCRIRCADRSTSSKHLQFEVVKSNVFVQDLGSKNGTKLGRTKLVPKRWYQAPPKATIHAGNVKLYWEWPTDQATSDTHVEPTLVAAPSAGTRSSTTAIDTGAGDDGAETQAYNNNEEATMAYNEEATMAYNEDNVEDNNATMAYGQEDEATMAYHEVPPQIDDEEAATPRPSDHIADAEATMPYDARPSPDVEVEEPQGSPDATMTYAPPPPPVDLAGDEDATMVYDAPVLPPQNDDATLVYDRPDPPGLGYDENATLAYEADAATDSADETQAVVPEPPPANVAVPSSPERPNGDQRFEALVTNDPDDDDVVGSPEIDVEVPEEPAPSSAPPAEVAPSFSPPPMMGPAFVPHTPVGTGLVREIRTPIDVDAAKSDRMDIHQPSSQQSDKSIPAAVAARGRRKRSDSDTVSKTEPDIAAKPKKRTKVSSEEDDAEIGVKVAPARRTRAPVAAHAEPPGTPTRKKAKSTAASKRARKEATDDGALNVIAPVPVPLPATRQPQSKRSAVAVAAAAAASSQESHTSTALAASQTQVAVLFTGIGPVSVGHHTAVVNKLGGRVTDDPMDCTHLVADQVRRTVKFLAALSRAKYIVNEKWLDACKRENTFVSTARYGKLDKEEDIGCALSESMHRAASHPLFQDKSVHITKSTKPSPSEARTVIECGGGTLLLRPPTKFDVSTIIVSCNEDLKLATNLASLGYTVYDKEWFLKSVLQQRLLTDHILVEAAQGPSVPAHGTSATGRKKSKS